MKKIVYLYWLVPLILWILQLIFTFNSFSQIRYEDYQYKEVYFFARHLVWDPLGAGDLGFYGTMYLFNNFFGFQLFGFKIFRLALDLVSLFALAALLKKWLGEVQAIVPLLTIGLSPTFLFFNTLQVPYGIDLQYFPIVLFLILSRSIFLGWFVAMLAWLSYASFIFYLPILMWASFGRISKAGRMRKILISLIAFILPFAIHVFYITNKDQLFDLTSGQGLFTGAGIFSLSSENFYQGLSGIFTNLFIRATAFHFEVAQVDFSGIIPALVVLMVIFVPLKLFRKYKEIRMPVLFCVILGFFNILLTCLIESAFNGFRRNTPFLASIYGLFVITYYLFKVKRITLGWPGWLINVFLGVLLLHHLIVYPLNLQALKIPSPFLEYSWFEIKSTPQESFNYFQTELARGDLYLDCRKFDANAENCNYTDLYSALMSDCLWNHRSCHDIYGYLPQYKKYAKLTVDLLSAYDHERGLPGL